MKITSLASLGFALFIALGAVASPVDLDLTNDLAMRDEAVDAGATAEAGFAVEAGEASVDAENGEADILIRYDGVSSPSFIAL